MQEKISVLIVDDNTEMTDILHRKISDEEDFEVVGVAENGCKGIELIEQLKPDVVILDMVMPQLDGIGVLEKVKEMNLDPWPLFVVLSAIGQDKQVLRAINLGIEYYMVKPFDIDMLICRIRQIYNERETSYFSQKGLKYKDINDKTVKAENSVNKTENKIEELIKKVGVPNHMLGYKYIIEAVLEILKCSRDDMCVTKVIYPKVAEKFESSPEKVERAIRNAIEKTWQSGNQQYIDTLFGYTINYHRGKPTNSEFLAMIADKIRLSS